MSSAKFKDIMSKFPNDKTVVRRLEKLADSGAPSRESEYTFEFLLGAVSPSSPEALSLLLAEMQTRGLVEKIVRVVSPSNKGGIRDFHSLSEVPEEIHDWRTDRTLMVTPDDLRVVFKLHRV